MRKISLSLVSLVAVAAIFYFWALGRADIVTDESSYATRAIGLVDFDFGIKQPTSWQLVKDVPWWMHLSFHDHPPFVFWIQHYSIKLFGENPFAIRVPSALAGMAAVVFLYLIGRRLWSREVGLAAAALFALSVNHVWISRIGLQESILIALMLGAVYFFLLGLERRKFLPVAGIFLGLAFLSKYISLILIPIFVAVLLIKGRRFIWDRKFYFLLFIFCFLVIASPVIIYNIQLYRTLGHFDFQFSLLFQQRVPEWPSRPAQEALGSLAQRLKLFLPQLFKSNSPLFLALSLAGLGSILWEVKRGKANRHLPLLFAFAWIIPFLIFIGPTTRFLTILTPWLALAAGYLMVTIGQRLQKTHLRYLLFALLLSLEGFYAYSSVIAQDPIGRSPWTYSELRRESHTWGFNQLDQYLNRILEGKMPEIAITFADYNFSRDLLQKSVAEGRAQGRQPVPWGIVFDDNLNVSAQLWVFLRRLVYHGWPITDAQSFLNGGETFFRQSGVKKVFFITSTKYTLRDRPRAPTPDADSIERSLRAKGARPTEIKTPAGDVTFRVYQFEFQ